MILLSIMRTSEDSLSMGLAKVFMGRATGCCLSLRDGPGPGPDPDPPWEGGRGGRGANEPLHRYGVGEGDEVLGWAKECIRGGR